MALKSTVTCDVCNTERTPTTNHWLLVRETSNSLSFLVWDDKKHKTHGHVCGTTCAGTLQSRVLAKLLGHNHKEVETKPVPAEATQDMPAGGVWPYRHPESD